MTFTKERLEELSVGHSGFNLRIATPEESMELARIALASQKVEPVGYIDAEYAELLRAGHIESCSVYAEHGEGCVPVYAAPPAPVVPDDGRAEFEEWFKFHHGDEHSIVTLRRANGGANYLDPHVDLAWIAWKDSRAAMLQGKADGRYPLVPDEAEMPSGPGVPEYNVGWANGWNSCREEMLQSAEPVERLGAEFEEVLAELIDSEMEPVSQRDELPEGWVAVPVEPTLDMVKAGAKAAKEGWLVPGVYRAMLAAAPQLEVK